MIINNAARAGFLELKDGKPVATGIDGCDGYLLWCAVNEPKNYMALLARVLPYYVSPPEPTGKGIMTYEETLARLRERGLPPHRFPCIKDIRRRAQQRDRREIIQHIISLPSG
jgi:hypothetical protein